MFWGNDYMFLYVAYGLKIQSAIVLPELAQGQFAAADITIRFGTVKPPTNLEVQSIQSYQFAGNLQDVYLENQGVGKFLVCNGSEIIVEPAAGVDEQLLGLAIHEGAIALALLQRGYLLLHGSVAVINGQAIAFLGASGRGKSTTVAALHRRGYSILTDDLAVIDLSHPGQLTVLPGTPQINLLPASVTALGYAEQHLPLIHPYSEKRAHHASHNFPDRGYPLRRVYLLEYGDRLSIQPLPPQQAFITLLQNSYGIQIFRHVSTMAGYMAQWQQVIRSVGVFSLSRLQNLETLPDLLAAIEEDVNQEKRLSRDRPSDLPFNPSTAHSPTANTHAATRQSTQA
jgi:hypothetical protein